jgi:hypothetical protein
MNYLQRHIARLAFTGLPLSGWPSGLWQAMGRKMRDDAA